MWSCCGVIGIHRCFECKKKSDDTLLCSVPSCGRYYHAECLSRSAVNKSKDLTRIVCSRHSCATCMTRMPMKSSTRTPQGLVLFPILCTLSEIIWSSSSPETVVSVPVGVWCIQCSAVQVWRDSMLVDLFCDLLSVHSLYGGLRLFVPSIISTIIVMISEVLVYYNRGKFPSLVLQFFSGQQTGYLVNCRTYTNQLYQLWYHLPKLLYSL